MYQIMSDLDPEGFAVVDPMLRSVMGFAILGFSINMQTVFGFNT